eukprot:TRINITY_DN29433_c0_g1_i1.p1 TRINITY_DN29433_c0_g1~~TRINITY_DN29433_c0_g1_i1.p1  ORF type:complete len:140 (+),score=48.41 TRINITY_DN29433_c0_g1_i1:172-591(+)
MAVPTPSEYFDILSSVLQGAPDLVKQWAAKFRIKKALIQFSIAPAGEWHCVFDNGAAAVHPGKADKKPDVTLMLTDENFLSLVYGDLNPQLGFMQGKLKIKGNLMLAQKMDQVIQKAREMGEINGIPVPGAKKKPASKL